MRYLNQKKQQIPDNMREIISKPISADINENHEYLKLLLDNCVDAIFKPFNFGQDKNTQALLIFFDGLVDRNEIENNILRPLMLELNMMNKKNPEKNAQSILQAIQNQVLSIAELKQIKTLQELCHSISSGDTVILIDGFSIALVAGTRKWEGRSIATPENESVVRGPKDGFTETLRFNTASLRRRLKSTSFKIEPFVLGRITKTDAVICYIDTIAPKSLVDKVKDRINEIDIDGVLDTGVIEEFIEDHSITIFSQAEYTEKPDRVTAHLLEGRVAIMVDGSPMALVVPTSFPRFLNASEDYSERYVPASLFRVMRFLAFWIALLLPSIYVSTITYHHEMIPTALFLTIVASREGIPFPAFVEALLMELTFELLREAGLRLPSQIGPAISIVGALIIGDAAVRAGLVSTPMVVVVAFTGIASFVTPMYSAGIIIRIARFGFLFAAAFLGFFGIMILFLLFLTRAASITSMGEPYLTPFAPFKLGQISDTIIRRPWFESVKRPKLKDMTNIIRQDQEGESNE